MGVPLFLRENFGIKEGQPPGYKCSLGYAWVISTPLNTEEEFVPTKAFSFFSCDVVCLLAGS